MSRFALSTKENNIRTEQAQLVWASNMPHGTVEIKSKNKKKSLKNQLFQRKAISQIRQKNKFLTRTLYSPIIVKISLKRSSSPGGRGREQKDKEQTIAVTQLSTTWSSDLRLHPWNTGLPPTLLLGHLLQQLRVVWSCSHLWAATLTTRSELKEQILEHQTHFPLLCIRKNLQTRQTLTKNYLHSSLSRHFIFLTYGSLLHLQFQGSW